MSSRRRSQRHVVGHPAEPVPAAAAPVSVCQCTRCAPPEVDDRTWWLGAPVEARRVEGRFGESWRPLVEVVDGYGRVFHLDDIDGRGWAKVTTHRGSPSAWHRELRPQEVRAR